MKPLALGVLLLSVGCATPYAYTFRLDNPGARPPSEPGAGSLLEDADLATGISVNPAGARGVILHLTNKTDQVLQVEWTQITMTGSDGTSTTLGPDEDLGWISPGQTLRAFLVPFALPPSGSQALGYEGRHFELTVPMIVRREPKLYHYGFAVSVHKL